MNITFEQDYKSIKDEVGLFVDEVIDAIEMNPEKQELCKGWRIMYSPLIYKPEIMFIGINPGAGWEGTDLEHNDKKRLEYLDFDDYKYTLARETKEVFQKINAFHLLEKSVKTNYYYVITTREKALYEITDFLGRGNESLLGERFFTNSRKWTQKLIEISQPKIIICEGSQAFANVTDLYVAGEKLKEDCEELFIDDLNSTVIGYKRNSFGGIKNKEMFAEVLKKVIFQY